MQVIDCTNSWPLKPPDFQVGFYHSLALVDEINPWFPCTSLFQPGARSQEGQCSPDGQLWARAALQGRAHQLSKTWRGQGTPKDWLMDWGSQRSSHDHLLPHWRLPGWGGEGVWGLLALCSAACDQHSQDDERGSLLPWTHVDSARCLLSVPIPAHQHAERRETHPWNWTSSKGKTNHPHLAVGEIPSLSMSGHPTWGPR